MHNNLTGYNVRSAEIRKQIIKTGRDYSGSVFKSNLYDHDVPCAVCFVKSRGSMLMIPAQNDCPWLDGPRSIMGTWWLHITIMQTKRITSVLTKTKSMFMTLSNSDQNGALLYHVEGNCGSLPCLPNVQHRELTCPVCIRWGWAFQ